MNTIQFYSETNLKLSKFTRFNVIELNFISISIGPQTTNPIRRSNDWLHDSRI